MNGPASPASSGAGPVRAAWRIARSVVHGLHGVLICACIFPFLDASARMHRVGWWSARMLDLLGIEVRASGVVQAAPVLLLANHVSWLDILAINAVEPARFVSKADVRAWPLLGYLIESGGTLFIERERKRDALRVVHQVADALKGGARVAVFPEGTTGVGPRLLPFHANLQQAAIASGAPVQAVALRYADATSAFSAVVAWIGETSLAVSVWRIASCASLRVHVTLLPAIETTGFERRTLSESVRAQIQGALDASA